MKKVKYDPSRRILSFLLCLVILLGMLPGTTAAAAVEKPGVVYADPADDTPYYADGDNSLQTVTVPSLEVDSFSGKTVSILSHSMSTYAGVSNNTAYNSTIGNNDVYYTAGRHGVYREDTWWQQAIDALGMRLLVNNSWSGSCVFQPRKGEASVGYGDRAVNLHNDRTGEDPDIIWVYLGCNDFAYYKDSFGKADAVDYSALIRDNGDGTFTYAVPQTTCEAYAIMLHKVQNRYPDAEIYCMTSTARRATDYTGDSYPDAGQPTEYSAQLQEIATYFGYPVVDLEKAIPKEIEIFDKYMGDKRAHANALGMDQITNEVLSVMLGRDAEIRHVTSEGGAVAEQAVLLGGSYRAEVDVPEGYSVSVAMGGTDISEEAYADGVIFIEEVTGDIEIALNRGEKNFRWELKDDVFDSVSGNGFSENKLTLLEGSITDGIFSGVKYALADTIYLNHDKPWVMEWACTGNWDATLFANAATGGAKGVEFLFRSSADCELLAIGAHDGKQYNNYGIPTKELNLDMTRRHVYRLENRVSAEGNMVWLYIDGNEIGPMNRHYIGSRNDTGNTSNWLSGKDFAFGYMGTIVRAINYCTLEYMEVWEGGVSFSGKTLSILGDSISTYTGVSNNTSYNSTIGSNAVYYSAGTQGVYQSDTWWQQTIDALGMELLVNNSWSGSAVLYPRSGRPAYESRCVQLHNNEGEEPDVIAVFMGTNDFSYYQSTLGTADIDYDTLITDNGDGTFTYATPTTTCEAYAIMLHKMTVRYPDAEIYCMTMLPRRDPDKEDSYADVGQPTAFNAELSEVIEHFGCAVVDLENCGIDKAAESFDLYIADQRVHPGPAGMDKITEALVSAMLGRETKIYSVSGTYTGVQTDNTAAMVVDGMGYTAKLTPAEGYSDLKVTVTMGGVDVTETAYANGIIHIEAVAGDIVISATAQRKPLSFRWEYEDGKLVSTGDTENTLTKLAGTTTGGVLTNTYYRMDKQVVLRCDLPWVLEWSASGAWSGMILSAKQSASADGNTYIFKTTSDTGLVAFGQRASNQYQNYGVSLTAQGVDTTVKHTYRLVNQAAADGTNMVYLWVDGVNYGAMNQYHISSSSQGKVIDWVSGKNLTFSYIGANGHAINNCVLDYIQVWEGGEPTEPLSLRYDDHYDVTGKTVEIIDAGTPTSYQVGYGVEENSALDTAVVTLDGDTLVATGIGTAEVMIDGVLYEVTVEAAPISLLLLIGQSNMRGSEGNADQSIVCPEGMVYATFGDDRGDAEGIMNVNNATKFAASALAGPYSSVNVEGTTEHVSYYPLNSLTEDGAGKFGPDSGFAYEWVQQTGEKVWIVNAAHGGSSITSWQPNATNFKECVLLFSACQETLRKEIAAGHYTLSHMGYYWCQGCSDYSWTAEKYVTNYLAMHGGLKQELSFDHDSDTATSDRVLEFAGIIPVRAGHDYNDGYREGTYNDSTDSRFYESFKDLQMTGPRVAQYWMCNNPELKDVWMVCNVGEDWVTMPDGSDGVSKYFNAHYENGRVDYTTQVAQKEAWYTPATPKAVHDSIHYNQIGYNELGRESVRNTLIMLGEIEAPNVETDVRFLGWDGYTEASEITASLEGNSGTLVVPKVYPVWKSKEVSYTLSEGLIWDYYDLLVTDDSISGTLTADASMEAVTVTGHSWSEWERISEPSAEGPGQERRVCTDCGLVDTKVVNGVWQIYDLNAHLLELPEYVCCDTNLWALLPHEDVHFTSGKKWGNTSTPVTSITIPVNPGDRIYATSWNKAGENGHATSDGIRLTFFDANGITLTLGPGESYRKFAANGGWLEAPEGSIAINVAMWYDSEDYEVYILNREHIYENGNCLGCGEADPDYVPSLSLRYDDHYDVTGKTVEIIDAGAPTSCQVGYGVEENAVLDTAVVTLDGDTLIATGIGTAQVKIDGVLYEVEVTPAPISLFMITGHSMGAGQSGSKDLSVVGPDGQVYSSHGTENLSASTAGVGISYAARQKANGINAFTETGAGTIGEGSALAWEWNRLTGEKVWVLNTAVGGSCLAEWIPGTTNYNRAVAQYQRAQIILSNEIAAGHYTLSHMCVLYHNGANFGYKNITFTQQDLQNWYDAMWSGFKSDCGRDMDGNGTQETVSFLGLVPIWTKSAGISYTQDEPAGLFMAASEEYPDIFTASVIGQEWLTNANVAANFPEITYKTQNGTVPERPDTTAEVFASDNVHYQQVGYNAVGIDMAQNLAAYLAGTGTEPDVTILLSDGKTEAGGEIVLSYNTPTLLVPVVEPITASGLSFAVSGCVSLSYPLQVTATQNGTGTLTVSYGDTVLKTLTFTCTDAPLQSIPLRYDDRYDVTGKTVEIIDAGTPTSYQVGYGVAENAVLDTAVVTLDSDTLVATGIGIAKVKIDGMTYEITVTAAPISLLLLAGQSNMQGSEGDANQSIVCPDGMVYSTYGDRYTMTVDNATNFAPSALTGSGSALNVNGTTTNLSDWPVYLLNEAGVGKAGPDSGFAYEWVKQTGEKVWVVNAAHGGSSITTWQDGGANYEEAILLFNACQETLRQEIAAGHYTLSHMGYFWCQGCTDYSRTAEWYVNKYLTMHSNFKTELAFDADSDPTTPDVAFEFGGIIPVRAGHESYTSYRQGVYVDTTTAKYHESFKDLRFTGPRVAQYWMTNNPDLPDIWNVCNIGEDWVWMPDGTNGVTEYFQAHYEGGTVDYTTQVAQKASWYTPTTPAAVHDSIHYNQIGYNEVGRESARNALILLGEIAEPDVETTVEFLTWDGYTQADEVAASTAGNSATLVVPKVYPVWKSKDVIYTITEGLRYEYYDLLAESKDTVGILNANGAEATVSVVKAAPGAHFAGHLSQLPKEVCRGLNLWNVLEHDKYYYANGTGWGIHSSGTVYSVTIPVSEGDMIFATSFGKAGENGSASSNGIRVTFFSEYGVAKTMAPSEVYPEFTANGGHLVAPAGTVAVNVAMWNNDDSNELYILSREHDTSSDICSICGKDSHTHDWSDWQTVTVPSADGPGTEQRECSCGETETREVEGVWQTLKLSAHMAPMPENYCAGTNLWTAMEHDEEFFSPGTQWHVHSSGTVYSVTIPVEPGDMIYASSFGKGGTHGSSSNGIRVTFFDAWGMVKTLAPAETYAEFTANGGYLIAPEGTVAVNIPMWTNSDEWEIYILNREHSYEAVVTLPTCTEQGYTTYTCTICGDTYQTPWLDPSAYEGKTLACVGDSITAGVGVTKDETDYVTLLAEQLGMNYIRLGASGTTLCTEGSRTCNIGQLTEARLQGADVVTIAMGINDFCAAAEGYYELGDIDSTDSSTIYGAVRMWCEQIEELRKTESLEETQFYFVTPVITSWNNSVTSSRDWDQSKTNVHGYTLRDLCNAILDVAALYDVPVVDLNLTSGMYYISVEENNVAEFGGDGVHPGEGGHAMMANALADALLQNDLRDDHDHVYGSWITTVYSSCQPGEAACVCSVCSNVKVKELAATSEHEYTETTIVPTCTEQGYTTYTCTTCGDSYVDSYMDALGHTYSGTTCTVCGGEHPEAADYAGKVISILSASTSTFAGYIPVADGFNLEHRARYPQDNLLTDVNDTWWMQVINDLDAKLGINDSWAGSQVLNTQDTNSGDLGPDAAMASLTRIQNLGANGTPDLILFFGGGNDMGRGVVLGSFDPDTAPAEVDLTSTKWDSFADAYVTAIMRLQYFYPDTEIVVMTTYEMPSYVTGAKLDRYGPVIKAICEHYGVKYVDLRDCGVTFEMLPDGIHPNAVGMDYITADVLQTLLNDVEMEAGENVVHSVTHDLTNAHSTLHYYQGVSHGRPFATTLTGDDLTVTVTMGGVDVTDTCYTNGVVTIPSVTGDLVVTAKAKFNADGHLQQLPEEICAGVNLWTALQPENIYYTANGWGNTAAGTTWSITFPVKEGDRIWATSLGPASTNGSGANGVRVTWFDENGVLATLDRNTVYAEFAKNGYITAPEGAVALNLPMTNNQAHYAVYILSAEHSYSNDICTICGEEFVNPVLDGHLQQLPENICGGTNLWSLLEPENLYYTANGWGLFANEPNVHSVTFPVVAGERLWATSFQAAGTNGLSASGTRITWFDENGVLKSLTRDVVYAEFASNGYITVPEGAVAVNIPMASDADTWELYILNREHDYSGTTCSICGATHPEAADYSGKVISIMGDSISTFAGYIPVADGFNRKHLARYPQDDLLTDVNETWWMQVISDLDAKLGINDSWRGATLSGWHAVTTGDTGENAAMSNLTRIQNLGSNGTPDVILLYGGTNDLAHVAKIGSFDPQNAPTTVDLTTTKWDNLADGFLHTILRIRYYYPDAVIVAMLPTYTASYYSNDKLAQGNAVMAAICEHYGVTYVDLRYCGITTADLPDGIHPDAVGMDYITGAVLETLVTECEMEAGENVVYSVTHELAGVTASLGYYKGISAGETFTETLAADSEMTVAVTMGGVNITDTCYSDGTITISSVTGDLVITAEAKFSLGDRLQQLPENICAGTNLWPLLEHDADYYTVDGWGVHSSGKVYSVTIPINPGDQIWATSFGKAGTNGSSTTGIRLTWFGENGVIKSLSADETYSEFTANGYLTAPEGANAVNVVMWTGDDSNELYILNLPHDYSAGLCTTCGHDAVTVAVESGALTITSDELEEGTLLYLAAYDKYGKFLSMKKIVWSGTEQSITLPEGAKFKLMFVDSAWLPLRTALDI